MATSKVVYLEKLRTKIEHLSSGQTSITDAPMDNHGKGEAFSPTDLLATSLASCMLTVVGIRARSMGFDIDGSTATVTKTMASEPRRVSQIDVDLTLKGSFSDGQKSLFTQIVINCPVAKSLNQEIVQNIRVEFEA